MAAGRAGPGAVGAGGNERQIGGAEGPTGGNPSANVDTVTTRTYPIEYKTNLNESDWTILQSRAGDGTRQTVRVPLGTNRQAYHRFLMP
jgi:hypothetical protein